MSGDLWYVIGAVVWFVAWSTVAAVKGDPNFLPVIVAAPLWIVGVVLVAAYLLAWGYTNLVRRVAGKTTYDIWWDERKPPSSRIGAYRRYAASQKPVDPYIVAAEKEVAAIVTVEDKP